MEQIRNLVKKTSQIVFNISYIWAILLIVSDIVMIVLVHKYVSNYNYLFVVPMFLAIIQGSILFAVEIFSSCEPEYYIKMKTNAYYFNIISLISNIALATIMGNNGYLTLLENILLPGLKTFFTISYSIERCVNIDRYGFIIEEERYLQNSNSNNLNINVMPITNNNLLREVIIIKAEDTKTCSICIEECIINEDINNKLVCMKNCKHVFHEKCIKEWVKTKSTCPLCRQ